MDKLWRFWTGLVGGIVVAETEKEAIENAEYYLSIQFDDIGKDDIKNLSVWKVSDDDDFREDYPYVCAIHC